MRYLLVPLQLLFWPLRALLLVGFCLWILRGYRRMKFRVDYVNGEHEWLPPATDIVHLQGILYRLDNLDDGEGFSIYGYDPASETVGECLWDDSPDFEILNQQV